MESIKKAFNDKYWTGAFYSSDASKFKDDRANALAVLAGLADASKHEAIVENVLIPIRYSSPHIEWMVQEALCRTGHYAEALARMRDRYRSQVENRKITTLYEMFPKGGTYNHAWNAPNAILSKRIAGIAPIDIGWKTFQIMPHLVDLTSIKTIVPSVKGTINVSIHRSAGLYVVDLTAPEGTTAVVGIPKEAIQAKTISANGVMVWKGVALDGAVPGIVWNGEDATHLKFNVAAGRWRLVARD
jgi:hypothetical protein